jgi:hypothetical protein
VSTDETPRARDENPHRPQPARLEIALLAGESCGFACGAGACSAPSGGPILRICFAAWRDPIPGPRSWLAAGRLGRLVVGRPRARAGRAAGIGDIYPSEPGVGQGEP